MIICSDVRFKLFNVAKQIASRIVMFLPRNVNLNQLAELSLSANPPWSLEVCGQTQFQCWFGTVFICSLTFGSHELPQYFQLYDCVLGGCNDLQPPTFSTLVNVPERYVFLLLAVMNYLNISYYMTIVGGCNDLQLPNSFSTLVF